MYATPHTTRNACIATAFVLAALAIGIPTAAADTPQANGDGSVSWGDCLEVDVWTIPPAYYVNIDNCIPA